MSSGRHTRPPSDAMYTRPSTVCTDTNSPTRPCRRSVRRSRAKRCGCRCTPRMVPFNRTKAAPGLLISSPDSSSSGSTPSVCARRRRGSSSSSVVTWVISARFFTSPHDSPSGVSLGQSMPHCEGCSARGPDTLRVFSNCDVIRVIIPSAEMNDRRDSTWVTPLRSIRKRFTVQLPLLMACSSPLLSVSWRMHLRMSNCVARLDLDNTASAWRFRSALSRLKQSSNSSASSCPASSRRLLP
mmetsp:Transcript_38168/g.94673  ORF Transcript_38168/g.94673 Transcript_38168/m.94673 type:complete len:241 (+) Transcript_38168:1342-2064(+)